MALSLPLNAPRPRDWRWRRCLELVERHQRLREHDDGWVRRGVCFLRALTRCADQERPLRRLYEQMPDLYEAYDLRHRGEARKRPLLLEVHLRAGTPVEDIARLTGCRLPVVRTYGHLFMAVPDPPPGASAGSWANACAWGLGAFLLDVCLEYFRRAAPAEGEGGRLDPSVAEHLCDALWVKVAVTLTALVAAGHDLSAVAGPVQAAVRLPGPGPAGADGWGAEVRALESILGQLGELRARTSGGHPAGKPSLPPWPGSAGL